MLRLALALVAMVVVVRVLTDSAYRRAHRKVLRDALRESEVEMRALRSEWVMALRKGHQDRLKTDMEELRKLQDMARAKLEELA